MLQPLGNAHAEEEGEVAATPSQSHSTVLYVDDAFLSLSYSPAGSRIPLTLHRRRRKAM